MQTQEPPPLGRAAGTILYGMSALIVIATLAGVAWGINHLVNHTHLHRQPACYSQSGGALSEDVCP